MQGQDYMVDVASLPNQALIIFGEWLNDWTILAVFLWPLRSIYQLKTVDIQINRLVPWKQLKKYHTFPMVTKQTA